MIVYTVFFLILVYYVGRQIWKSFFSKLKHIPMPPAWPIIGHTFEFLYNDNLTLLENWGRKYKGVFRVESLLGDYDCILFVTEPEYMKEILSYPEKFVRNDFFPKYFPSMGNGLLNATGKSHQFQKKILSKSFSSFSIKKYYPVFQRQINILVEKWKKVTAGHEDGLNIVVEDDFRKMIFDAIGEVSFSSSFNAQSSDTPHPFITAYEEMTVGSILKFKNRLLMNIFPFLWYMPFGPAATWKNSMKSIDNFMHKILETRQQKLAENTATDLEKNDLLSAMMTEKDEKTGEGFSDELIKNNIIVFLIAGHETTATALPGVLLFLAKYPHYQEKARQEIFENITDESYESVNSLVFTSAFLKECLRMYPAIPYEGRMAAVDCTFGGYHIPKGTGIFCLQLTINKHESFDRADEFLPERYLPDSELSCGQIMTFGYGPYNCIGKHLATQQMKLTLVCLLQQFRFEIDEEPNYYRCANISLKTFPKVKIRVIPLKDKTL